MKNTRPSLHDDWIDPLARRVVQTLQHAGYQAYLVGGCVRDLLAGIHPKDFDIATSAFPNDIRRKVPNSYVIGKRFRLVLVKRGDQQFEVATFRRNIRPEEMEDEGNPIIGDNYFGTVEEDAVRRDFTINALFYDPVKAEIIDFVNGRKDVEDAVIRMIGSPKERLIEDPIRILRALRLSHKLGFRLEENLRDAMCETAPELKKTVLPRRREEYLKMLRLNEPGKAFRELDDMGVLGQILPTMHDLTSDPEKSWLFERIFSEAGRAGIDFSSPLELFSAFLYALLRARNGEQPLKVEELENDGAWNAFMKDELGMFKLEAGAFFRALELMPMLETTKYYLRKGHRRQIAFLSHESMPLALKLSQLDFALDPRLFEFWVSEIRKARSGQPLGVRKAPAGETQPRDPSSEEPAAQEAADETALPPEN